MWSADEDIPIDVGLTSFGIQSGPTSGSQKSEEEQPIYFASPDSVPSSERRLVRQYFLRFLLASNVIVLVYHRHTYHICGVPKPFENSPSSKPRLVRLQLFSLCTLIEYSERIQSDQSLTMIRKLAIDYVNFIKECWVHASVRPFHS